ncbi:hypothetical protein GUJ93_ZPchr0013g34043 [Zizania palustris]|uniref:Uncharacterized protein n=1 Tax=Zizania palustris TaxID=103762 RepID=A0A8J6BTP5_ZIZPA|nr:hypothetical protein GUJ93_ZPchr0013g34043 [Zizania palustris]
MAPSPYHLPLPAYPLICRPFPFFMPSPLPEAVEEPRSSEHGKPPVVYNPSDSGTEQCRIQNMDDGTKFEVRKVHEEVVREVGTGRQLTFKEFELCIGHSPIV